MSDTTWACEKCEKRNGMLDKKCWNCGKKRPASAAPDPEIERLASEEERAREAAFQASLPKGRPLLGALAGLGAATVSTGAWVFFNTGTGNDVAIFSILLVVLQALPVGAAVSFFGRGYRIGYGLMGGLIAGVACLAGQVLIISYHAIDPAEMDPMDAILSGSIDLYLWSLQNGLHPFDLLLVAGTAVIAGRLSWRSKPGESRIASFLDGLGGSRR